MREYNINQIQFAGELDCLCSLRHTVTFTFVIREKNAIRCTFGKRVSNFFGIQPKRLREKWGRLSRLQIHKDLEYSNKQTNKQTNSKISPAMYHNTHIFWCWPFKYTVFFDLGSVKKIEIFGRELPLRRASVSKKKFAANAAIFFDNSTSRGFDLLIN